MEERKELDYDFKMSVYNDGVNNRHDMDKAILIMNLLIIIYSVYMMQTYNWFIIPCICSLLSYTFNIISDRLGCYYSIEQSHCKYIDEYDELGKYRDKYITLANKVYECTFFGSIASIICAILFI